MIKASRVVVGGDKPYQGVQIMLPGELDSAEVNKVLGDGKTVVLMVQGPDRRSPKWVFTHSHNLSLIILDDLVKRGGGAGSIAFERIVVGNASFGAGNIVPKEAYGAIGVPQELMDAGVFDEPLVFVVSEGLCVCNAPGITAIESVALAPKAKKSEMPELTTEPLASMRARNQEEVQGPTLEQVERAEAAKRALAEQHGGPLRGAGIGGSETFSEAATDQYGDPVSRDITRAVVQDPGPGREGGPINPDQEFDALRRGDAGDGHGKNFGAPEGLRGESIGEPGAAADRAVDVAGQAAKPRPETAPVTNAARTEDAAKGQVEAKPVAAPAANHEEQAKSKIAQPPKPKAPEAPKPKADGKEGAKDLKATDPTKQTEAASKPPTGSEADKAAKVEPVKVSPAPGQEVEVKDAK